MALSWAIRPSSGGFFVPTSTAGNEHPGGGSGAVAKEDAGGGGGHSRRNNNRGGLRRPLRATNNAGGIVGGLLMKPPSPPRDVPSFTDIDALEQALNFSIRTAGLKPGRENQLADEAARLRRRRKGWAEETEKVHRAWVGHASLLWELHEQELSKLNNGRREKERRHAKSLALVTKQLEDERERGCAAAAQERDAAGAQLRAAQEGHELWKKAHQEEITKAAEREIARITARLRRDAEQHARSAKENLEAEYRGRLVAALEKNKESQAGAATAQDKITRLESVARRLEAQLAEAAERTRRIERLSQTQKEVGEEVKLDLEKRAERLCRRLEDGKASIENERSAHESAVIAIKAQWREELRTVDERVRAVVGAKDQATKQLAEDLEMTMNRAETAEALLEELQVGVCAAAHSPSRDSVRHQGLSSPPRRGLSPG